MKDEIHYVQVKATNGGQERWGACFVVLSRRVRHKHVHCNMAISFHRCVQSSVYESKWIPNVGEKEAATGKCGQPGVVRCICNGCALGRKESIFAPLNRVHRQRANNTRLFTYDEQWVIDVIGQLFSFPQSPLYH